MKTTHIVPGTSISPDLVGAVIVRDLAVGGDRWSKGRRLSAEDLATLGDPAVAAGLPPAVTALLLGRDDVHEDDAALRLAAAIAGPGLAPRGPSESRVNLVATADGIAHVRTEAIERLDRIDPLAVFTLLDGQAVRAGDLVASVKIGPHAVPVAVLERGVRVAARSAPLVRVAPFLPRGVAVVVKQSIHAIARERFEATVRAKVESLGSTLLGFEYVADEPEPVAAAIERALGGRASGGRAPRGRPRPDVILTAGGASTDPGDPFFLAIERCGGSVVRHGVPAHPGSMVWLARIGRTDLLGLPTCGAYSKATAVDLLLPRLLTGERASAAMGASLGVGGLLTRSMRFRFPPYARDLDAPDG